MAAKAGAIRAGRAFVELYADDTRLTAGLRRAERTLRRFGQSVQSIGETMLTMGTAAATPVAGATIVYGKLSDKLLAVKAVTGATEEQFKALSHQAKELGRTTSWTAGEVADAQMILGQAGFVPGEILSATPAIMDLARATRTELAVAAEIAGNAIRQFNLSAADTPMVADVLAMAANASSQNVTDLGEALSYAGPIAQDFGETLQSTSTAIGVLANMGIKGSMAGTVLRQIMLQLTDSKVRATLQSLGVTATDAAGNLRPLGQIMLEVGRAASTLPQADRLSLLKELFDQRAVSGVLKLSGSGPMMEKLATALANASGTAAATARGMDAGLGGAWRRFISAVEGGAIAVGEALEGMFSRLLAGLTDNITAIASWIENHHEAIRSTVVLIGKILAAGAALLVLAKAIQVTAWALGMIRGAVQLVTLAIANWPVTLGIAAAVIVGWMAGLEQTFHEAAGAMADALRNGDILGAAKILWGTLKVEWLTGKSFLLDLWGGLVSGLSQGILWSVESIVMCWHGAVGAIEAGWIGMIGGIKSAWAVFSGWLQKNWARLKGLFDSDFDVQAEIGRIDAETQRVMGAEKGKAAARWAAMQSEWAEGRASRAANLTGLRDNYQEDVDARAAQLAKARQELAETLAETRRKQEQANADGALPGVAGAPGMRVADLVAPALPAMAAAGSVTGAFDVGALLSLQAGDAHDAEERTAKAAEETARNTAEMLGYMQESAGYA